MSDFWAALGLVLVLEGLSYAAFPQGIKKAISQILLLPDQVLRRWGFVTALAGLIIVYISKYWS